MPTLDLATKDIRPLRAHCTGPVAVPGEKGFREALGGWGMDPADPPAAVAFPADGFDEAAIHAFARYAGLRVTTRRDAGALAGVAGSVFMADRAPSYRLRCAARPSAAQRRAPGRSGG